MKTTRFRFYLTLAHSVIREMHILCSILVARIVLRVPDTTQIEGLRLAWSMRIVAEDQL